MSTISATVNHKQQGSYFSYTTGFAVSLGLTLLAYLTVTHHVFASWNLVFALAGLAVVQLAVQLIFFLHLGRAKSHWNTMVFAFMLLVVLIIVFGSLWIMYGLNYRMMSSPEEVNKYMNSQESL
jgi:cytochrome o ubiquinol oxidase operon protein cyoD